MAKIPVSLPTLMASRDISISSHPSAPDKIIIKRASFRKGEVPRHLAAYLIRSGECKGRVGKLIYKGLPVSASAVCVAEKRRKGRALV